MPAADRPVNGSLLGREGRQHVVGLVFDNEIFDRAALGRPLGRGST